MITLSFSFISDLDGRECPQTPSLLAKGSWSIEDKESCLLRSHNIQHREPRIRIEFDEYSVQQVDFTPSSPELQRAMKDLADLNGKEPYYLYVSDSCDSCSLSTLGFEGAKRIPIMTGSWDDSEVHIQRS